MDYADLGPYPFPFKFLSNSVRSLLAHLIHSISILNKQLSTASLFDSSYSPLSHTHGRLTGPPWRHKPRLCERRCLFPFSILPSGNFRLSIIRIFFVTVSCRINSILATKYRLPPLSSASYPIDFQPQGHHN
jgi:hypothetical protein